MRLSRDVLAQGQRQPGCGFASFHGHHAQAGMGLVLVGGPQVKFLCLQMWRARSSTTSSC